MPSTGKPLSKTDLAAYEATRDLAAELLQSVREMKAGHVQAVMSFSYGGTMRGKRMGKSSRAIRLGFAVASAIAIMALALYIQNWLRGAAFNWPVASSMSGLIILMATGAIDLPHGPLRVAFSAIAIMLISIGLVGSVVPAFLR